MTEENIKLKCLELAISALKEKSGITDYVIDVARDYYKFTITKTER